MKVIYIHQYFKTPADGGSLRSYYLAKALVRAGHQVEMITGYGKKEPTFKNIDGIRVHYLPVYYDNTLGFWGRMYAFGKFVILSYRKACALAPAHYCYASSTPLTVGFVAWLLKKSHRIPYFFEVRDLWPEAPIQLGVLRNRFLIYISRLLEKKIYQSAQAIVGLSPGMCSHVQNLVPTQRIVHLPNMSDCHFFHNEPKSKELLAKYDIRQHFVICYPGTLGQANHLMSLLTLAKYCQEQILDKQILFLIVGEGAEKPLLEKTTQDWGLKNVRFMEQVSKLEIREILNISDAVYISFVPLPVLETSSPNKFFDSLAAGKICLVNTSGWLKSLVENHACGFYVSSEDYQTFGEQLKDILNNPIRHQHYRDNARHLAESLFDRPLLEKRFLALFIPPLS